MDEDKDILLDLDGMVVDLEGEIIRRHNDRHGTSCAKVDVQYDDDGEGKLPDLEGNLHVLADWLHEPNMFRRLSPLPGAQDAVDALQQMGNLYIASSPSRNDDSASDKIRWVKEYLGLDRKKVILLKPKWLLRGKVFLEDWPNNLRKFRKTNPTAFLGTIAYPHNEKVKELVNVRAEGHLDTLVAWQRIVSAVDKFLSAPSGSDVTYRRGVADGRWRHPPAELSADYLKGYRDGLEEPDHTL